MSGAQVADELGISASKVSRMETGNRGLHIEDVATLLGLYRVPEQERRELLALVWKIDESNLWVGGGSTLPTAWRDMIDFESRATRIQNFESLLVPGLLQIPEYTAAIIGGLRPELTTTELDELIATRVGRQVRLRHQEVQFVAVVDEMVLHRVIGDHDIMRRQLRHLVDMSERPNITLRVLPLQSGTHAGLRGPFVLMDFAEEATVGMVETQAGSMWLDDDKDLAELRLALSGVLGKALKPIESAKLVSGTIRELKGEVGTP
jgi:transcriptional regulator with XRE-family HTH domain